MSRGQPAQASQAMVDAYRRFAEITDQFEAGQRMADDSIPSDPSRADFDGVSPAVRIELLGFYRQADETKRKRLPVEVEVRTCRGCWRDFEVEVHAHRGRVRDYCLPSCKQKAYRLRRTGKNRSAAAAA